MGLPPPKVFNQKHGNIWAAQRDTETVTTYVEITRVFAEELTQSVLYYAMS